MKRCLVVVLFSFFFVPKISFATDVDVTFDLQSPVAISGVVSGNLGTYNIDLVTSNREVVFRPDGVITEDANSVYISGSITMPSFTVTGDAGATIDVSIADKAFVGADFKNFVCAVGSDVAGDAGTDCDTGDGFQLTTPGGGGSFEVHVGFKLEGDNGELNGAAATTGSKTAQIEVTAVYN